MPTVYGLVDRWRRINRPAICPHPFIPALTGEVVRFGDKLKFRKDVEPATLDMQLPSMLLQPLIENCIKHGLSNKVEGGSITLRATRVSDRLHLLIEDDGVGFDPAYGARPLKRAIQRAILNPLSVELLSGKLQAGDRVQVDIDPKKGDFTFERAA
jgi:LytS/YehU family sensor histidine kinase